jgi:hypothetical protein
MRLARLAVPGLDQAGQEGKPTQADFKRHPGIRIRLFGSNYKEEMSDPTLRHFPQFAKEYASKDRNLDWRNWGRLGGCP